MKQFNRESGKRGEEIATEFLTGKGFTVIERNYFTRFGEIDLIAVKDNILRFIEVKLKQGDDFGTPEEMIGADKLGRVQRMAEYYLLDRPEMVKKYESYSIDAVCIVSDEENKIKRISYYENIGF